MLGIGLTPEEIAKRLIRLNNLERLHSEQKLRIEKLVAENRVLRERITQLETENRALRLSVDDLKLQLEELRAIVFGKKRKKEEWRNNDVPPVSVISHTPRPNGSYRRKLPQEDEITEIRNHPLDQCMRCGGSFSERESKTYYEEDIPLPQKKIVICHVVEKGYCKTCRSWSAGVLLPTAPVILGENVKRYVVYLSVICRESYAQIEDVLKQTYDFNISQGEIAKIMMKEGERLRPEYERLKAKIRGEPSIHLDETGWNILMHGGRGFAWTMTGGASKDAVFALGKNRGKGNAEDLIGNSKAIIVSDDYGAYRTLKNGHQLCCAHIVRKLRDLATTSEIGDAAGKYCRAPYETFVSIYADIETARQSKKPMAHYNKLLERLVVFSVPCSADPKKLLRVKTQVAARPENYLTCLRFPNVAPDNNAAERSLRHLVIKRKISFGSISKRTAETMAILLSLLFSWKQRGELRNYLVGV